MLLVKPTYTLKTAVLFVETLFCVIRCQIYTLYILCVGIGMNRILSPTTLILYSLTQISQQL